MAEPELQESLGSGLTTLEELIGETVREGQKDGSLLPGLDPKLTASALLAVVEGALVTARTTGRQSTADDATAGALALHGGS